MKRPSHCTVFAESPACGLRIVMSIPRASKRHVLLVVQPRVYASSSSVYGDADEVPFSEDARCDAPVSLYAATKRSDELLAYSYAQLYGMPITDLRFFTVYGPMGRPDMAYFSFAQHMVAGEPIRLFNEGNMLRDFTYIDDVVAGFMQVIEGEPPAGDQAPPHVVYNLGHGSPVNLGEFVRTLEEALRRHGALQRDVTYELLPMQPGDVHRTFADTRSFEQRYAFRPRTSLAEGLDAFAAWYAPRVGAKGASSS